MGVGIVQAIKGPVSSKWLMRPEKHAKDQSLTHFTSAHTFRKGDLSTPGHTSDPALLLKLDYPDSAGPGISSSNELRGNDALNPRKILPWGKNRHQ